MDLRGGQQIDMTCWLGAWEIVLLCVCGKDWVARSTSRHVGKDSRKEDQVKRKSEVWKVQKTSTMVKGHSK